MPFVNKKINSRIARQIATILSAVVAVIITASGVWSAPAQASALSQKQGQQESSAPGSPDATCPAGGQCFADVPSSNPFYTFVNRIYQQDLVTGYACGGTDEPCDQYNRPYYRPGSSVTRQQMAKYIDNARHMSQIDIAVSSGNPPIHAVNNTGTAIAASSTSGQALTAQSSSQVAIYAQTGEAAAVSGYSTGSSNSSYGVYGSGHTGVQGQSSGDSGFGVYGSSSGTGSVGVEGKGPVGVKGEGNTPNGTGVVGKGYGQGDGVMGFSSSSDAVYGESDTGIAVYGWGYPNAWAGWFLGNVRINGTCCGMSEVYTQIDNPLDPANKYLNQSLVQSPDMTTVINDNATLDAKGEATVTMPTWFEAGNRDFRYTLTAIGAPGPNLYVAQELAGNQFRIAGGVPGGKVSWQVIGIRQDAYAAAHPLQVEQTKTGSEQGKYLSPELYGQPESKRISTSK